MYPSLLSLLFIQPFIVPAPLYKRVCPSFHPTTTHLFETDAKVSINYRTYIIDADGIRAINRKGKKGSADCDSRHQTGSDESSSMYDSFVAKIARRHMKFPRMKSRTTKGHFLECTCNKPLFSVYE